MKKIIRHILNLVGLQVSRKSVPPPSYIYFRNEMMIQGLERARQRGLQVKTIIDVGAASGSWSLCATELWPDANYILFEPLGERKVELEALTATRKNFHYIGAAAGKENGTINFHVSADLDGSGVAGGKGIQNLRKVEITSIAHQVELLQTPGPYIVKLDTHGFEVPIIEGCETILNEISLFIIECDGFHITNDSLLFWEMCRLMEEKGFRLIDIIDVSHRPKDLAFWQCDAFFAPASLDIFKDNSFL
jgi:FkbM family methyltransferase